MASSQEKPPTYHVVPHFNIAAKGGSIQLGTVVNDLLMLEPLNRFSVIPPGRLCYPPVSHGGFTESRSRLREGSGGIWAKALVAQGVGLSTTANAAAGTEHASTVTCDEVVTTYFDPDSNYIWNALTDPNISDYFAATDYKEDVYLVTGLKVARNLRYNAASQAHRELGVSAEAKEPTDTIGAGVQAQAAGNEDHSVSFTADDIVVGFRVKRYAFERTSWNPLRSKVLTNEDYLEGAEMYTHKETKSEDDESKYEEVPIPEEQGARKDPASRQEDIELWVDPTI
ncbi:hypothetical protein BFJ70_g4245 [Fusarium oxysporum]|nr:hypothetical protein BFJ70_g4245 [Fusarium oxysporum]